MVQLMLRWETWQAISHQTQLTWRSWDGAARGCREARGSTNIMWLYICGLNAPHADVFVLWVGVQWHGALSCVFGAAVAAVDITFILLSRVLKALFRSGVFSDGETACHCRGEFRLSAQPTDNMLLGWVGGRRGGRGAAGWGWRGGEEWGKMELTASRLMGHEDGEPQGGWQAVWGWMMYKLNLFTATGELWNSTINAVLNTYISNVGALLQSQKKTSVTGRKNTSAVTVFPSELELTCSQS